MEYTLSLYDKNGKKLRDEMGVIDKAKAYEFTISSLLDDDELQMEGSMEVIFTSKQNLVFALGSRRLFDRQIGV